MGGSVFASAQEKHDLEHGIGEAIGSALRLPPFRREGYIARSLLFSLGLSGAPTSPPSAVALVDSDAISALQCSIELAIAYARHAARRRAGRLTVADVAHALLVQGEAAEREAAKKEAIHKAIVLADEFWWDEEERVEWVASWASWESMVATNYEAVIGAEEQVSLDAREAREIEAGNRLAVLAADELALHQEAKKQLIQEKERRDEAARCALLEAEEAIQEAIAAERAKLGPDGERHNVRAPRRLHASLRLSAYSRPPLLPPLSAISST